jgi:hypothetical protein
VYHEKWFSWEYASGRVAGKECYVVSLRGLNRHNTGKGGDDFIICLKGQNNSSLGWSVIYAVYNIQCILDYG